MEKANYKQENQQSPDHKQEINPEVRELERKREQLSKTCESLFRSVTDQGKLVDNLKLYYEAGRGRRVAIFHENLPPSNKLILLNEASLVKLNQLASETAKNKREYSFLGIGHANEQGCRVFSIVSDLEIPEEYKQNFYSRFPECLTKNGAADLNVLLCAYSDNLKQWYQDAVKSTSENNAQPLIFLGHTHPHITEAWGDYSLPDLDLMEQQKVYLKEEVAGGHAIDYMHCVVTESGDINFMRQDHGKFAKVTEVYDQNSQKLNNYTFESPVRLVPDNANYVREDEEELEDYVYNEVIGRLLNTQQ